MITVPEAPRLWIPKVKVLEPKQEMAFQSRIGGRFKMDRLDGQTRKLRASTGWFNNLVLNNGLDLMGAGSSWLTACRVGTGTNTPVVGDTNLQTHLAGTSSSPTSSSANSGASEYYSTFTKVFEFGVGVAAGSLTEVGIGSSTANGANLFSRALLLDIYGDPTTLVVLGDEILQVTYEIRNYPPLVDVTGSISISAVSYDYVIRAADVDSSTIWAPPFDSATNSTGPATYNGVLGSVTDSTPTGASGTAGTKSDAAYSSPNYYRDHTFNWSLSQGNAAGGISAVGKQWNGARFQCSFDPVIPKDSSKVLALTFRRSWTRHTLP